MNKLVSHGFTLVETIVAMLIISIAALAMASALGFAFSRSSDGLLEAKVVYIAQSYLEEIQARRYDEATPSGGTPPCQTLAPCSALGPDSESRQNFDDVDDYDGLLDSPPRDSLNQIMSEFTGFSVAVAVDYADAAQIAAWNLDAATDAKVVSVTVTTPDGQTRPFVMIRGNY
ncbi:MAG: prepilin-type N-terminal cleavage/methylation domain-containing protein [Pseudomonadaceae bacterium]|nr:prepilin-type N-terminal cleavage/methylation domain-containing protein [Pseudomonadaceae bacterium]